jgi:hypothetical protein
MDTNCDGIVDFNEFVAATLHAYQLEEDIVKWNKRIFTAFQLFDTDNNGYITPEELKVVRYPFLLNFFLSEVYKYPPSFGPCYIASLSI